MRIPGSAGGAVTPLADLSSLPPQTLRVAILDLARRRGAGASFCPSEPARALRPGGDDWRALMPALRVAAAGLQAEGIIEATQAGRPVAADTARGPIRLRLAAPAEPDRDKTP